MADGPFRAGARPAWAKKRPGQTTRPLLFFMVGTTGFEPATPASRTQCSTKLSHVPTGLSVYRRVKDMSTYFCLAREATRDAAGPTASKKLSKMRMVAPQIMSPSWYRATWRSGMPSQTMSTVW